MGSKNDAANRRLIVAKGFLFQPATLIVMLLLTIFSVVGYSATAKAQLQINTEICNGGNHTPLITGVTPSSGSVVISPTVSLAVNGDWLTSVSVLNGADQLGSATGDNTAGQTINVPISLEEGVNNLTIDALGGCPEDSTSFAYSITYIKNAATFEFTTTNNTSPALSGRYEPLNTKVFATVDGTVYDAVENPDGSWDIAAGTISPDLAEGSYDIYIEQQDASNVVVYSHNFVGALVIDTTAPLGSTSTTDSDSRSPEISGATNDSESDITVTVNDNTYDAINNGDGTWTLPAGTISPELANGTYQVVTTITDQAGNVTELYSTLIIDAPNELGFILAPNTGYIRINSVNIPSWILYVIVLSLVVISGVKIAGRNKKSAQQ